MARKQRLPEVTSPKGVFKFPAIHAPYYGSDEYPDPDGTYGVRLILEEDAPETQAFLKKIIPHYQAAIAAAEEQFNQLPVSTRKKLGKVTQNCLYDTVYDPETEEPTGQIELRVKMKAGGTFKKGPKEGQKWSRKPMVYDAKMNRLKDVPEAWGGTVGRVSMQLRPYFVAGTGVAGLQLALQAVQIIDLIEGGERSAESLGFEAEEGYTAPTEAPIPGPDSEEDGGDF